MGRAIVPSGASTGRYEANELRDKNEEYLKYIFKNFNEVFDVEDNKDAESYFYYLLFINSSKNSSKKRDLLIKWVILKKLIQN